VRGDNANVAGLADVIDPEGNDVILAIIALLYHDDEADHYMGSIPMRVAAVYWGATGIPRPWIAGSSRICEYSCDYLV
jgi:hypothetical protein